MRPYIEEQVGVAALDYMHCLRPYLAYKYIGERKCDTAREREPEKERASERVRGREVSDRVSSIAQEICSRVSLLFVGMRDAH